jgi:hypothetical protein
MVTIMVSVVGWVKTDTRHLSLDGVVQEIPKCVFWARPLLWVSWTRIATAVFAAIGG